MDESRLVSLGSRIPQIVKGAISLIQNYKQRGNTQATTVENSYTDSGVMTVTPADLPAQQVYTRRFAGWSSPTQVLTAHIDALYPPQTVNPQQPIWLVEGLNGSRAFSQRADFGYGTQCALLLPDGSVPIAFVGNAITGDIIGYYGPGEVFLTKKEAKKQLPEVNPAELLVNLPLLCKPPFAEYSSLSKALLRSELVGRVSQGLSGITAAVTELLKNKVGVIALRPHYEQPWSSVPAYAVCQKAGIVFMRPSRVDKKYEEWTPRYSTSGWERDFDLFMLHRSRLRQFHAAVARV